MDITSNDTKDNRGTSLFPSVSMQSHDVSDNSVVSEESDSDGASSYGVEAYPIDIIDSEVFDIIGSEVFSDSSHVSSDANEDIPVVGEFYHVVYPPDLYKATGFLNRDGLHVAYSANGGQIYFQSVESDDESNGGMRYDNPCVVSFKRVTVPHGDEGGHGSLAADRRFPAITSLVYALEARNFVPDSILEETLENSTIEDIQSILHDLVSDDRTYDVPGAVAAVVRNQPHHSYYFREWDYYNSDIALYSWSNFWNLSIQEFGRDMFYLFIATTPLLLLASFFLSSPRIAAFSYHEKVYGFNAERSIDKSLGSGLGEGDEPSAIDNDAVLNASDDERTFSPAQHSFADAEKDYRDAVERIASYEMDVSKAISFPAFNDVTVAEVSKMLKQLRKCGRLLAYLQSVQGDGDDYSVTSDVGDFISAVDDLWVDIQAAERAARRIAWSGVSESERKDLRLAEQLVRQINDTGNTDELRQVLYSKLKSVVDRLNSVEEIIPARIVAELESSSMGLSEKSREKKESEVV